MKERGAPRIPELQNEKGTFDTAMLASLARQGALLPRLTDVPTVTRTEHYYCILEPACFCLTRPFVAVKSETCRLPRHSRLHVVSTLDDKEWRGKRQGKKQKTGERK